MTYRWGDHSMRANLPRYRTEAEEVESGASSTPSPDSSSDAGDRARLHARRVGARSRARSRRSWLRSELAIASAEPTLEDLESAVYAPHYQPRRAASLRRRAS